jgi:hypothetical protein
MYQHKLQVNKVTKAQKSATHDTSATATMRRSEIIEYYHLMFKFFDVAEQHQDS